MTRRGSGRGERPPHQTGSPTQFNGAHLGAPRPVRAPRTCPGFAGLEDLIAGRSRSCGQRAGEPIPQLDSRSSDARSPAKPGATRRQPTPTVRARRMHLRPQTHPGSFVEADTRKHGPAAGDRMNVRKSEVHYLEDVRGNALNELAVKVVDLLTFQSSPRRLHSDARATNRGVRRRPRSWA
jgi:hypothetical protein